MATPSFRLIDYSARQAKHAERRILCDAFRRLSGFGALPRYQYVGFGAIWFADFSLFHRSLGIENMFCIEREAAHAERFRFNRPFGGIQLMFGPSAQELPKIDWSRRSMAWLDYDDPLQPGILEDVRMVAERMCSGSVLAVSVQAHNLPQISDRDTDEETKEVETVAEFRDLFGTARTPSDLAANDIRGWKIASLYRRMLASEIAEGVRVANGGRQPGNNMKFRQILALEYADGARMATVAFVFYDEGQEHIFSACSFQSMPFYADGPNAVRLDIPKLTPKEMREIEARLPTGDVEALDIPPLPQKDVKAFARLYRYLPRMAFFEA